MGVPNLAPASPANPQADLSGKPAVKPDLGAAAKSESEQIQAIDKRVSEGEQAIEKRVEGLRPPKLELAPQPPAPQPTNPQQAWASTAMLIAAVGSLMTRQPMLTAMNAAAGVLDAYRQNDQARANAAYQQWKVANDNAIKLQEFQLESYRDILGEADRQERLLESDAARQERSVVAQFNATAAAFRDDVAAQVAQERGVEGVQRLLDERERLLLAQKKSAEQLTAAQLLNERMHDWLQEHPNATPDEKLKAFGQFKQEVGHQWTDQQKASIEQRMAQSLTSSDMGKQYSGGQRNLQTIESLQKLYPKGVNGPVAQAALGDAYTQVINGGRAIRGFQARMNTEHAGLWDKAQIALEQLNRGGYLSPSMIKDMVDIARQVQAERQTQFDVAVDHAKSRAKDMGLDPEAVVPDIYQRPGEGGGSHAPPTPLSSIPAGAIQRLKAHPNERAQFDQIFGQGAAAQILGQ